MLGFVVPLAHAPCDLDGPRWQRRRKNPLHSPHEETCDHNVQEMMKKYFSLESIIC